MTQKWCIKAVVEKEFKNKEDAHLLAKKIGKAIHTIIPKYRTQFYIMKVRKEKEVK